MFVLDEEECEGGAACRGLLLALDEEECVEGACRGLVPTLGDKECEGGAFRGPALVVDEKVEIEGRAVDGIGGIR